MDAMGFVERMAMSYFKRLVLPLVVIGCVIAYDFTREGAVVYKMPVARAHDLLESAGLPDYILGDEKEFEVDSHDPRKIVWIVKDGGSEALRFAALLSPVDAGSTEVRVEVSGPTSGPFRDMQRRLAENRIMRHLYVMGMKERVAATLEGRKFSIIPVIPAASVATLTAMVGMAVSNGLKPDAPKDAATRERERQISERAGFR